MANETDFVAGLEPLFAAERERLLDSMEEAARALARPSEATARSEVLRILARDAHGLKGAAQIERRQELCELTEALERRLDDIGTGELRPSDADLLVHDVALLRRLSRGTAPAALGEA